MKQESLASSPGSYNDRRDCDSSQRSTQNNTESLRYDTYTADGCSTYWTSLQTATSDAPFFNPFSAKDTFGHSGEEIFLSGSSQSTIVRGFPYAPECGKPELLALDLRDPFAVDQAQSRPAIPAQASRERGPLWRQARAVTSGKIRRRDPSTRKTRLRLRNGQALNSANPTSTCPLNTSDGPDATLNLAHRRTCDDLAEGKTADSGYWPPDSPPPAYGTWAQPPGRL